MSFNTYLDAVIVTLSIFNTIFHSLGFYLLICLYTIRKHTCQQVLLINLAFVEAFKNLLYMCANMRLFMGKHVLEKFSKETSHDINMVLYYISLLADVIAMLQYFIVAFLTIDRFLAAFLNIKYFVYCKVKRVQYILAITWLSTLVIFLILAVITPKPDYDDLHEYDKFYNGICNVYLTLDITFIIIASVTYTFLFCKHLKSKRCLAQNNDFSSNNKNKNNNNDNNCNNSNIESSKNIDVCNKNNNNNNNNSNINNSNSSRNNNNNNNNDNDKSKKKHKISVSAVFRRSQFYISFLLIGSFILLMVIPDMIFIFMGVVSGKVTYAFAMGAMIPTMLSDSIDAWIYIFMYSSVRNLFLKKIRKQCCCCKIKSDKFPNLTKLLVPSPLAKETRC